MTSLPRSTPQSEDVDPAGIRSFIEALETHPEVEPHSIMLLRHGSVVAEGWWAPYSADRVHLLYSLSKSFTSTAAGFAVAEGLMGLDNTVLSHFPELDAEITDPRSRSMRVRHIAAMASGHRQDMLEPAWEVDPVDLVRGFLLLPPDDEPGTVFAYNQPCTFALGAIVQRVSGQSLTEFLRPRLFDPLGIGETGWQRDASGREIGWSGMFATTEAIAKLGQLYLHRGQWNGAQLLDPAWVDEATRSQVDNSGEPNPDWQQGYGFQFWMARHGYRGDGAYGQFCVVLPEHDVVLAMTGQSIDMQAVLDAVWTHLLPAFDGVSPSDDDLSDLLGSLRLPPTEGEQAPTDWDSRSFVAATGNDQPQLGEVQVSLRPDGVGIRLIEGDDAIDARIGFGEWTISDAVAVSGGWKDDALTVDVVFVETPHRLQLECDGASGTFSARWATEPLRAPLLSELRMPRH